ncbi:MAG: dihydropteroate synthase [Deltaproteobacteria bacterium]|nr:dihydropteroate synthase [Deltaproteobacteria bacterium]
MRIGSQEFDFSHKVYLMGVLNLTPDSFSDGGLYFDPAVALDRALQMEEEGAQILDIGAESSRPGSKPITEEEEERRLFPVLKKMVSKIRIPISIDTRRSRIAEIAIKEGGALINDITALRYDFRMGEVIAEAGVPCILMHMRGEPETMQQEVSYINVVSEIVHFLRHQMEMAIRIGIPRNQILLDPGIGFGKAPEHNLEILKHLQEFRVLENPLVIGASRKSFIRRVFGIENAQDPMVRHGSLAVAAIAAWNGASMIRVHDVRETAEVLKMVEALCTTRIL